MNSFDIIGRLGKDPEVTYTAGGKAVATLSIADSQRFRDRESQELRETVTWHRVTLWEGKAENAGKYLTKGAKVWVRGHMKNDDYQRDGETVFRMAFVADEIEYLAPGKGKPAADAGAGGEGGDTPGYDAPQRKASRAAGTARAGTQ